MDHSDYVKYSKPEVQIVSSVLARYNLSDEQRDFYNKNGYLVINELIPASILNACKQRFIDICNGVDRPPTMVVMKEVSLIDKGYKGEKLINKIQDILYDDVFSTYFEDKRLLHVLSQLIGPNITAMHSMLINKPPGTGRHPPHQDLYYFPFRPADKIIASWTAIDAVYKDNGCLFVIPGSHRGRLYAHDYPPAVNGVMNKMYHGIIEEEKASPESRMVHVEMSPGDTVLFHPLLVHGSGPNTTQNYRKAISCHYAANDCHYIDVTGTVQENIALEVQEVGAKKYQANMSFQDIWKYRSKHVQGVKCNL